ncbi:MAG: Flp pilus assembly protein CpaB [Ascidiaceihabitans sp.]|jgi:pilus assembly protein CpaB|nr:Flp pilus assembly protein CpaB [Ascidiaceihabitans sp.]
MRMVFGLVLLVGVALAGGAVYMAKNYIGAYQNELARERASRQEIIPTVDVYVAQRSLKYGEALNSDDFRLVAWPETAIPEGTFVGQGSLYPEGENDLRYVLRAMEKDEAIMAIKVTEPGEEAGITSQLERGMRAFAIKVDVASGVSGFLRPGDRVDVYWTGRIQGRNRDDRGEVTKLIDTAIKLIAIDQTSAGDIDAATIARTITVAIRPEQVAALAQAQSSGRLSLSLVGADDDTVASAFQIDQDMLLGIEAEEVTAELEEKKVCTIKTRRGAEVVVIPIPCTN